MAFIAGYLSKKDEYDTSRLQERVKLFEVLPGEGSDRYEQLVFPTRFGHVVQKHKVTHPLPPRTCSDSDGNVLVTLGFLCTADSMVAHDQLLAACVESSARALETCQGEFVAVYCEGRSGTVHIVNDRFASRPFYVLRSPDSIYFSSNFAFLFHLARGRRPMDILGWLQIFSVGHTLGARTTVADIKRLEPSTHLTIVPDGMTEKRYWRLEHEPEADLDPTEHGARVFEAFRGGTALRARLARRGVIALSGGLDSRLVAGALPRDVDFSVFTFINSAALKSTLETRAAAEICKVLELDYRVQPVPTGEYSRHAREVIGLTGGLRPLHHMAIVMPYIEEMKRRGVNWLLGGGAGSILAGSSVNSTKYLDPGRMGECIADVCRHRASQSKHLRLLFRDDVLNQYAEQVYGSLIESFEAITGPTAAHRVTAWNMVYRQPAFTFTSVIHNHPEVAEAFCHLDYRYCDLMLRLPASWLYKRNFYSFMIHNMLPQLRHVPYANTGRLLSGRLMHYRNRESLARKAMSQASSVGDKIARKLIRLVTPGSKSASFHYALLQGDGRLLSEIEECVSSYGPLRDVLDREKCQRFLDNLRNGVYRSYAHEEVVGSLATMCLSYSALNL